MHIQCKTTFARQRNKVKWAPHELEIHTSNIRQQTEQTPLTLVVDFAEKARKVREVN